MPASAIVLLAHGSPDPDWLRPVAATEAALRALVPEIAVCSATLAGDSLDAAIAGLAAAGHRSVAVMALFLSAGGRHVKHDIPQRVAALRLHHPELSIALAQGALGEDDEVAAVLARAAQRALQALDPGA